MAQRFMEFVMMQGQQAMFYLGLIPHPQTGQPQVNLDAARMFIDQLAMIREKTRGNLTGEETGVITNILSDLQMAFVEVTQKQGGGGASPAPAKELEPEPPAAEVPQPAAAPEQAQPAQTAEESKKKFSKSYGS